MTTARFMVDAILLHTLGTAFQDVAQLHHGLLNQFTFGIQAFYCQKALAIVGQLERTETVIHLGMQ